MIRHAKGPAADSVSREDAIKQLTDDPSFPKGAKDLTVFEVKGSWVAVWNEPNWEHTAEFPPSGGGPADSEEESPSPKSESPEDSEPSQDKGPSDGGSDGPPKEHKEHGGGEENKILHLLETLVQALGIDVGGEEGNPMPGEGGPPGMGGPPVPPPGPAGPPHGGPPGAGGPPMGGHGPHGPDQVIQHEKALKPGEAPPGSTPIGAPSFASVQKAPKGHPWEHAEKPTFEVAAKIPDGITLASVDAELKELAKPTIFTVKQTAETVDKNGQRTAHALISKYA